jgi:hypothetical protein
MAEETKVGIGMSDELPKLAEIFRKVLNIHGYGFQYRVMEEAKRLYGKGSRWVFHVAEFPVTVRGKDTRIDFVLRLADGNTYLVAECKRVNPAISNWCFARAPYVTPNSFTHKLIFRHAMIDGNANLTAGISKESSENIFHIAMEVPSGEKGDAQGSSRGGLEKAVEQVLLGVNGMIEFMADNKLLVNLRERRVFIPVIFTTARLFTTDLELQTASIERGVFEKESVILTEQPWIWLQYHQSPTLKHSSARLDHVHNVVGPQRRPAPPLGRILETEYARSIAIVNSRGIESFLSREWLLEQDRDDAHDF